MWDTPSGTRREPLLGWRVWRVREGRLDSWAASTTWWPGINRARCLTPGRSCLQPPGYVCRCGFWALFSPLRALERGRSDREEGSSVLGLVRGWGEVAVHGREGFRAQFAAVACLFDDWVWDAVQMPWPRGKAARTLWRIQRRIHCVRRPVPPDHERPRALKRAAVRYGVPLLGLEDALRQGLLSELGASQDMIDDVGQWLWQASPISADHGRLQ